MGARKSALLLATMLLAPTVAAADWECRGGAVSGHPDCVDVQRRPACDEDCRAGRREELRRWREEQRRLRLQADQQRRDALARRQQREREARDETQRMAVTNRYHALYALGIDAARRRRFDEARARLHEAERVDPTQSPQSLLNFIDSMEAQQFNEDGLRRMARRDYEGARNAFSRAAILNELPEYARNLQQAEDAMRWRPSGNGMILGTGAQEGWRIPLGISPEQRATFVAALTEQYRSVHHREPPPYLSRFDFGIGVAMSTTQWVDLFARVSWDQFTPIPVPEDGRRGYNALRGRQFDTLSCHSNGAMLCLLALVNNDVRAGDVVLYGPQVTPSTLQVWSRLLSSRQIRSLRVVVAQEDPITPAAMMANGDTALPLSRENVARFVDVELLRSDLQARLPADARVETRACDAVTWNDLFACHDVARYLSAER